VGPVSEAQVHSSGSGIEGIAVGLGVRDPSITIVAFCLESTPFGASRPVLSSNGRQLTSVGGLYAESETSAVDYAYYAPTKATSVSVLLRGESLAELVFPPAPKQPCPLSTRRPFRLIACQSAILVSWASPLQFEPDRVELIDGLVIDHRTGESLGFFMEGLRVGPDGLLIRFGFVRPDNQRVDIQVSRIYVRRASGEEIVKMIELSPPLVASMGLRAAAGAFSPGLSRVNRDGSPGIGRTLVVGK
jgi:hypothetical protein